MFDNLIQGVLATSWIEWVAVTSSIIYVLLAAKKIIWCWLFALISSILYVYICFSTQLYLESFLQFFYVVMAVVGYVLWNRPSKEEVIKWKPVYHILNLFASSVLTLVLGYIFSVYTDQANPYIDAATTVFSLATTFMVTQRVVENWIYWIVIDAVSVYLYYSRELHLTALLFVLFTLIAVAGYFSWRKLLNAQEG